MGACQFVLCVAVCALLIGPAWPQPTVQFTFPNGPSTNPSGLQIDSSGRVFVSAGNKLFRLSPDLVEEESISLSAEVIYRGVSLSGDGNKVVVCLDDLSCSVYNASDLAKGPVFGTFNNSIDSYSPRVFTAGDTFYVSSIVYSTGPVPTQDTIELGQYGFGEELFERTMSYGITRVPRAGQSPFERNFGGGFMRGGFFYYFVSDNNPSDLRGFRVMRVCHATGCPSGTSCAIQALYEADFDCSSPAIGLSSRICDVSVIDNFAGMSAPTVVVTRCDESSNRNYVCFLNLSDINSRMDGKYNSCSMGLGVSETSWTSTRPACNTLTFSGPCDFSVPLDDINIPPLSFLNGIRTPPTFTSASAAVIVESFSLLFVARRLTSSSFTVSGFNVVGNDSGILFEGDVFSETSFSDEVQTLSWLPGSDHILAATKVSVVQIPIEECSSHVDCFNCTADLNPLCGWCVVENKCSRQSQCQNVDVSTTVRWTQNSTECLVATVTPNQFIQDIPELLSVSVNSPGLPVPLTNETFSCHLADSEGRFSFTVPAVEVSPQTNYTCDIRGMVSAYQGVTSVINLSFVSSLFGVPFDTTNDALRIYNCTGTGRCSECLGERSPCGWCNYNKLCSGTNTPCRNTSTFLQLSGNTFEEVCPLVAPPPSGAYIQPVRLAQDIQLQTRNLPPPVDGFQYMCVVNNVQLSAVYRNETSITCTVQSGDLTLADGIGSLSVEASVMWTGNGITHSIDQLVEQTNVNLYDCQDMANECSPCIGSRLGSGFMCGWCDTSCEVEAECSNTFVTSGNSCPAPVITSFSPASGPVEGGTTITVSGTNLGVTFSDINSSTLLLGGVACVPVERDYITGTQFICETTDFSSSGDKNLVLIIGSGTSSSTASAFRALKPTVSGVVPSVGPMAGGTLVTVSGSNLDIGNQEDTSVSLGGQNAAITDISEGAITCRTSPGVVSGSPTEAVIFIDNAIVNDSSVSFTYLHNPNITRVSPQNTIPSGGIKLTFTGQGLDAVQTPVLEILLSNGETVMSNCTSGSSMSILCITPSSPSGVTISNYTLVLDGAPPPDPTLPLLQISVQPDPSNFLLQTTSADTDTIIRITGENFNSVVRDEITVTVGGEPCVISSVADTELLCTAPSQPPGGQSMAEVKVMIGTGIDVLLADRLDYSGIPLQIIIPSVAAGLLLLILVLVCLMCCIICAYKSKHKKTEQRWTNLLAQMELLEVEMADECKRAFTELQTDLADLVQISDKNLPYRDFRTFAMRFLFPQEGDDHPVLHPIHLPEHCDQDKVLLHLNHFFELMKDKKFLIIFVRSLEAQNQRFTLNDKCIVASLLMICFQNDLDYATEILQTLLADLMRKAVAKSTHPKLLLRRTESIAEKMLANWLAFLLFPYILEHVGEKLFILFRAIKSQLEKGPVDVVTGEAKNSLSEEKLLRHHREVKLVEGVIIADSGEEFPVRLLDCDSITQAKEKVLDVLYKNTPVSKRPNLTKIDLELISTGSAGIPLRDQDATNSKEGDWVKVNTLGHYKLDDMSKVHIDNPKNPIPKFRITNRSERPLSGISFDTLGTTIANVGGNRQSMVFAVDIPNVFHLVKPEQDDSGDREAGQRGQKIVSEVFLTRLLSTKRILQPYVDDLFEAIFTVSHGSPLPKAIKSLFDFLDLQASELGIQDPETLHTWKTNSVPLRFWVNLIKNPDFLFDINKSATVDACLTVIAQAYIDACSTTEFKYTKDTPAARLLYVNDVKKYKTDVLQYYSTVQALPKVSQYEMCEYLRETAQKRQLYFVTESTLLELFRFADKFGTEITDGLNEEGLTIQAAGFDQIRRNMRPALSLH